MQPSARLRDLAPSFDAHASPAARAHERDRALQRIVVCAGLLLFWAFDVVGGRLDRPRTVLVVLAASCLAATVLYRWSLRGARAPAAVPLYAFLALDVSLPIVVFALDPRFAFLYPLLCLVVVATGLRYGVGTMTLSWAAALTISPLVLASAYWREHVALTLAYFAMLVLVPAFFVAPVRKLHGLGSIENERALLAARHDEVVARSAFLAKVSHELRSPLQGIVSALDVVALRRGPTAGAEDEMIQRIRRSSLLLNTHLRDLLTLAKGEAGRLELRPEPFDACDLVDSVAASAMDLARDKKLALNVDRPPDAVFVVADSARIDQILTNLVVNSVRYTETGEVRLALRPYSVAARLLEFVVSDTGPGIPEAMLPTLLAPDRAMTGPERRGEGSGIGLAIVRTLVDHLGGRIDVESSARRGTTFTIAIPAEPVDESSVEGAGRRP